MLNTTNIGQYSSADIGEAINKATCDNGSVAVVKVEVIQGFYRSDQSEFAVLQQFKP